MRQVNINNFKPTDDIKENITKFQFYVNDNFPYVFKDEDYINFDTYIKKSNNVRNIIHFLYWYDTTTILGYRIDNKHKIYTEKSFHEMNKLLPSFKLLKIEDFNNYFKIIKNFNMNFPSEMPYEFQCIKKEIDAKQ